MRQMRLWKFFAAAAAGFLICLAVTVGLFFFQLDRGSRESVTRCAFVNGKAARLSALPGPKVIFIGGSSVHWGVNTETIGRALGRSGGNFGTYAALGPDVILWKARQILKPGDIAVLSLEYDLYHRNGWTSQSLDFVQGCGRSYFNQLSLFDKVRAILSLPADRVLKLAKRGARSKMPASVAANGDPYLRPSTFHTLSADEKARLALYQPLDIGFDATSRDVGAIRDFVSWARANKIVVWAAWPNTLYFPAYKNYPSLARIGDLYREMQVPLLGTPQDSMLRLDQLYDTQYHLNQDGIEEHTRKLLDLIKANRKQLDPAG